MEFSLQASGGRQPSEYVILMYVLKFEIGSEDL